ncbi:MAG: TlpA family protein disulfide reductase [Gemmatimonadota bacterium]|nr:TlpA family protein disulfide reductase [Gemmatimonadota bacterium]MDH3367071.1 TlpA family protein disulfide reductase [Gemmatimonadota bacterium]MDH3478511.1 TlpA family protein disulfide reductase [Gemmatimonadota bacterium]MDH3571951.1 TlpA family protein disulfide reductase [Gemmatimonadota bacterium]MDH5548414.1 TlpA family protein disulfide reductase [Gemmatimonadota bacterium]
MTQRGQWIFVLAIVGTLGAGLVAGLLLMPSLQPVGVESEAPNFTAVNVTNGDTVRFSSYRGEVILLNVWATWCLPCVTEMPSMQRLYDELRDAGLRVVAVSVDAAGSEDVREWVTARELTFDILHDRSGRIERIYQTTGVPESFVIDRDGVIVKKIIGPAEWDHPTQIQLMRRLLGSNDTVEERVQ